MYETEWDLEHNVIYVNFKPDTKTMLSISQLCLSLIFKEKNGCHLLRTKGRRKRTCKRKRQKIN